jgi:hypothetical protein
VTDFPGLIAALADNDVEYIVIGGFAGTVHGSNRLTADLDVVYRRTPKNLERVANSLAAHHPYPKGAPPGLPFRWDARTLANGLNFTLESDLGEIDLLGEITGGGGYEDLLPESLEVEVFGRRCNCLNLNALIRVKRAAGRPKDFEAIAELEAIRDSE